MMQGGRVTPERVQKAVEAVQSREELRHLYKPESDQPGWLKWLKDLFSRDSSGSESSSSGGSDSFSGSGILDAMPYIVAGAVVIAVVVGLLVYFKGSTSSKAKREESDKVLRAKLIAEQLEAARAAQAAGDLNAALRAFWAVLVTALGRGNQLVYRRAWTCREMLARTRGEGPDVELLTRLLPRVEELEYGRIEITAADVDELANLCAERVA